VPLELIQTASYDRDFFTGRSEGQKREQSRAFVGSRCRPLTVCALRAESAAKLSNLLAF
jgi:hypothetical protein